MGENNVGLFNMGFQYYHSHSSEAQSKKHQPKEPQQKFHNPFMDLAPKQLFLLALLNQRGGQCPPWINPHQAESRNLVNLAALMMVTNYLQEKADPNTDYDGDEDSTVEETASNTVSSGKKDEGNAASSSSKAA